MAGEWRGRACAWAWPAAHVAAWGLGLAGACATLDVGVLFAWHPALLSVGYLLAMAQATLAARRMREGRARAAVLRRHAWMQLAALCLVAAGMAAVALHKSRGGRAHLRSLHALVGAAAALATAAQAAGGVALYWGRRRLLRALGTARVVRLARLHGQAAAACHALVLAAFLLALRTGYAAARWSLALRVALAAALVAWAALTLFARPPPPASTARRTRPPPALPV